MYTYLTFSIPNEFNNLKSPESTFNLKGKIIFKDVNFSYDNKKILNSLCLIVILAYRVISNLRGSCASQVLRQMLWH